jgi:geranylgeranyl pyrophosphate synthase
MQLTTTGNAATTETEYLVVIQLKTAKLFAATSRIGGVLGARQTKEKRPTGSAAMSARHGIPAGRRHA